VAYRPTRQLLAGQDEGARNSELQGTIAIWRCMWAVRRGGVALPFEMKRVRNALPLPDLKGGCLKGSAPAHHTHTAYNRLAKGVCCWGSRRVVNSPSSLTWACACVRCNGCIR
jgi:hypothetical protein